MTNHFNKKSTSKSTVGFDWSDVLPFNGTSPTISLSQWSVSPSGLSIDSSSIVSKKTKAVISGGVTGKIHALLNTITTSDGCKYQQIKSIIIDE